MVWGLAVLVQIVVIVSGIRQEQRAGLWSWSKFVFALAFGAMEFLILVVPITYIDLHSRYFVPALSAAGILAALNFLWMIIVARRWRLPDGRTSIQAYRDQQRILHEQQPKR
ncbi:hypothetical protein DYQ86_15595 [Acidobacteria bacterium AB60]|nr:hypothetical protein DYQ86_15595 [Acidobacteria bacterium AB60]